MVGTSKFSPTVQKKLSTAKPAAPIYNVHADKSNKTCRLKPNRVSPHSSRSKGKELSKENYPSAQRKTTPTLPIDSLTAVARRCAARLPSLALLSPESRAAPLMPSFPFPLVSWPILIRAACPSAMDGWKPLVSSTMATADADRGACRSCCSCWLPPPPIQTCKPSNLYYCRTSITSTFLIFLLPQVRHQEPSDRTIAYYLLAAPGLHDGGVYVFLQHARRLQVQLLHAVGRKNVLPVAHRVFNFAAIYQSSSNHSRFFALQKSEQPGQQETSTNTTCKARNEHQHHLRPKGSNFWLCVLIGYTRLFPIC
jgi:hypothetical protein